MNKDKDEQFHRMPDLTSRERTSAPCKDNDELFHGMPDLTSRERTDGKHVLYNGPIARKDLLFKALISINSSSPKAMKIKTEKEIMEFVHLLVDTVHSLRPNSRFCTCRTIQDYIVIIYESFLYTIETEDFMREVIGFLKKECVSILMLIGNSYKWYSCDDVKFVDLIKCRIQRLAKEIHVSYDENDDKGMKCIETRKELAVLMSKVCGTVQKRQRKARLSCSSISEESETIETKKRKKRKSCSSISEESETIETKKRKKRKLLITSSSESETMKTKKNKKKPIVGDDSDDEKEEKKKKTKKIRKKKKEKKRFTQGVSESEDAASTPLNTKKKKEATLLQKRKVSTSAAGQSKGEGKSVIKKASSKSVIKKTKKATVMQTSKFTVKARKAVGQSESEVEEHASNSMAKSHSSSSTFAEPESNAGMLLSLFTMCRC